MAASSSYSTVTEFLAARMEAIAPDIDRSALRSMPKSDISEDKPFTLVNYGSCSLFDDDWVPERETLIVYLSKDKTSPGFTKNVDRYNIPTLIEISEINRRLFQWKTHGIIVVSYDTVKKLVIMKIYTVSDTTDNKTHKYCSRDFTNALELCTHPKFEKKFIFELDSSCKYVPFLDTVPEKYRKFPRVVEHFYKLGLCEVDGSPKIDSTSIGKTGGVCSLMEQTCLKTQNTPPKTYSKSPLLNDIVKQTIELINSNDKALKIVQLNALHLTKHAILCLSEALKKNTVVEELYLRKNKLWKHPDEMKILFDVLAHNKSIDVLSLDSNGLGGCPDDPVLGSLADALKVNGSIQRLYLYDNKIGNTPTGLEAISEALKYNTTLNVLYLAKNKIGKCPESLVFLSQALEDNRTIRMLCLNNNNLGYCPKGMEYLSRGLQKNKTLRALQLDLNNFGKCHDSMKYLSWILENNQTIQNLSLSGNVIGKYSQALKCFSRALAYNTSIQYLYLSSNELGECENRSCIKLFLEAIKVNTTIITLDLAYNPKLGDKVRNVARRTAFLNQRPNQTRQ